MRKPVVLRIYKGEQLHGVKQFLEEQIVLGRQLETQVPLNDEKVAVIHAALEDREGTWYLCDLGSETGTYLNGESILDGRIDSGDIIHIGDFRIEFYVGVPKPRTAPTETAIGVSPATLVGVAVNPGATVTASSPAPAAPAATKPTPATPVSTAPVASTPQPTASAVVPPSQTTSATPTPSASTPSPSSTPAPMAAAQAPPPNKATPASSPARMGGIGGTAAAGGLDISRPNPSLRPPQSVSSMRRPSTAARAGHDKKKKGKTFAPPSKYQSFREFVRPSKGTVVEVLVLWRERVINAHHFSSKAVITMGSRPDCDIVLPVMLSRQRKVPLLKIDARAVVLLSSDMTGELIKGQQSSTFVELLRQNRMIKDGANFALVLDQGEMIRLELSDQVSIIIRYTSDSPKPLVAPFLDLTAAEFMGVIMAIAMVGVIWIYNKLWSPPAGLENELSDEPLRMVVVEMEKKKFPVPPAPTPVPAPEPPPTPKPTPPPPPVKSTPVPTKTEENKPKQVQAQSPTVAKKAAPAADAAPNKNPKDAPKTATSIKQGAAVKTGNVGGAQATSQRKDISKTGMFSVFGGGGRQDNLSQDYRGAGELSGMANAATGRAGQNEDRPGVGLGSALKDTGRGGTGTAAVGVAGVKTKGRGSGGDGTYGVAGLGNRKGMQIVPGVEQASFSGSIDREAIRRVVLANIRQIRTCYERELNRDPGLFGKLVVEWVIGEQGRVMRARPASNELGNATVGDCVARIIQAARFPEPPTNEEVTVMYPFFFSN